MAFANAAMIALNMTGNNITKEGKNGLLMYFIYEHAIPLAWVIIVLIINEAIINHNEKSKF